ncbi:hypothetical protein K488DRAFT_71128 [Vararia minispora EC-137]|uniref:Uncharacterized protein n=1 Tax=Vararia minispora EC-137 TaxID=1314806 RepID=A0ACB8QJ56_9AGAM|nr:hypothetical protein K488DRAFT_71128 [Vararia minispora EC-137]
MSPSYDQRWDRLVTWLEGKGMLVDEKHLKVQAALFTVPASAHINIITLESQYPGAELSAVQLISLHLFLHKPLGDTDSFDPLFGPYISVLPRDFDGHPLTWAIRRTLGRADAGTALLGFFPPHVNTLLAQLERRFWEDWKAVREYLKAHTHNGSSNTELDYLWAWLNVNTRDLYHDLGRRRDDNISLCPVFDYANHVWTGATMSPSRKDSGVWGNPGNASQASLVCSSLEKPLGKDEELLLTYGAHSNSILFVEYGFVNVVSEADIAAGLYIAEATVDEIVYDLILRCGGDALLLVVREALEQEGYWSDWTLHTAPPPAYPSYRLLSALRLLHVFVVDESPFGAVSTTDLALWRDTVAGLRDAVSESNERDVRRSLRSICDAVSVRAERSLDALMKAKADEIGGPSAWSKFAVGNVAVLWKEERAVARAVLDSIEAGVVF